MDLVNRVALSKKLYAAMPSMFRPETVRGDIMIPRDHLRNSDVAPLIYCTILSAIL
jgi:hypothetical protein